MRAAERTYPVRNGIPRRLWRGGVHFVAIGIFILVGCFFSTNACSAALGETKNFYIDPSYDFSGREETAATLVNISNRLYFYVDNYVWNNFSSAEKNEADKNLSSLADEFEKNIYPTLTSNYGSEWKPGIDKDEHITVLIHPMKKNRGGYFYSGNEYPKFAVTNSNEREMVYLSSDYIASPLIKRLITHEFTHLITFNQKNNLYNIEEDTWLNEARAEYAITLLGYNDFYQGSNLQKRVGEFLANPTDSITEWNGSSSDYGVINIFIQYLVDHYGVKIINDSLHSSKTGIDSINYALAKNGFKACPVDSERSEELCVEDFSQIFTDWTITVLINDCSLGSKYCYKSQNLKNFRVVPTSTFLPINSPSTLSVNYKTKNWAGNWQKIIGGGGTLTLNFNGGPAGNIKAPYEICNIAKECSIKFIALDNNHIGKIELQDFNNKYASLTIIPTAQEDSDSSYYFSWEIITTKEDNNETELIRQLQAKIKTLKAEIIRVQAQIDAKLGKNTFLCSKLENNLYYGLRNNQDVRCLQEFLKNQGAGIYPEGLITGNFLTLTKKAIIRFQEKYTIEILNSLGLSVGTGFVGPSTRAKINQLLGL
jgi:hypothetical protein